MRGVVAGRRQADFDIPAPLPRVCSHIRGADAGGSAISWGQWWFGARGFEAGAVNWVLDPFLAERFLPPLPDRACVNACNDLCWSQFSARSRPRPPVHVWTYLKLWWYTKHMSMPDILQSYFSGTGVMTWLPSASEITLKEIWAKLSSRKPGPRFNIKVTSYQYKKSHCGDKTILRPSYLHNLISYTDKIKSLYWIRAQNETKQSVNYVHIFGMCLLYVLLMLKH